MGLLSRKVIAFAQTLELLVTETQKMIFALLVPHWMAIDTKKILHHEPTSFSIHTNHKLNHYNRKGRSYEAC
jgi:hypothetical protein